VRTQFHALVRDTHGSVVVDYAMIAAMTVLILLAAFPVLTTFVDTNLQSIRDGLASSNH
jgi:Flp pilus assembly pilin Flp